MEKALEQAADIAPHIQNELLFWAALNRNFKIKNAIVNLLIEDALEILRKNSRLYPFLSHWPYSVLLQTENNLVRAIILEMFAENLNLSRYNLSQAHYV